jgi:uncharacterized membrane protein
MNSKETNMHRTILRELKVQALVMLLFALFMAGPVSSARAQDFTIDDFHSDITISENGSVDVKETIVVVFNDARHGIYREIPYRYVDDLGDRIEMPVTVNSVRKKNGNPWTYKVTERGDVINIRIGDASYYVKGRQVYVINYTVENAILFFEDHDELYWNVTGNYWRAPIDKASASVRLNTSKVGSYLTGSCYTGRYGSDETACEKESEDNQISFVTTRKLRAGQGFTVAMGWAKGIVQPPSKWQKFIWATNLRENWVFIVPIVVLLFMFFHWYRRGRDPRVREAVTVMYEPPTIGEKAITPAQAGVLIDESLDRRDLTGSLIGLAANGYIKLQEIDEGESRSHGPKDITLIKLREPDDHLSRFERALMREIFRGKDNEAQLSDMKNKFYAKLPILRDIMFKELVSMKCFATSPFKVRGKYIAIGIGVVIVGALILSRFSLYAPWRGVLAGILSGVAVMLFAKAMPARTRVGALARMQILGFQEFMNRADKDRLERMGEHVFYKYLPYAIALDVVDHWVKAFDDILTQPPNWYVPSVGMAAFSAQTFTRAVTTTASHLGSTMFSAPRGSGSGGSGGGGGFSGGGGGGGGGGSW